MKSKRADGTPTYKYEVLMQAGELREIMKKTTDAPAHERFPSVPDGALIPVVTIEIPDNFYKVCPGRKGNPCVRTTNPQPISAFGFRNKNYLGRVIDEPMCGACRPQKEQK